MHQGHCLCGAVQFTVDEAKHEHHVCHCGMCRRWTGGAGLFAVPVSGLAFESREHVGVLNSSDWAERGFCTQCGTPLFYHLKGTDTYMMSVGAFADQTPFRLVGEICIDRKPSGYDFAGDHPRLTEAEAFAQFTAEQSE